MSDALPSVPPPPPPADVTGMGTEQPGNVESANSGRLSRLLILGTGAICFALFWSTGNWLHIPRQRGYNASLLQQPGIVLVSAIVAVCVLFLLSAAIGHLIAGTRWVYAGLFASTCGLTAWSYLGGPSRYVYFQAANSGGGRGVFLMLALESAILSAIVGFVWHRVVVRSRAINCPQSALQPNLFSANRPQAIGAQALTTAIVILILCKVDAKNQAAASVFLAGFIGASLTEHIYGKRDLEAWYWLGPALTGIVGYLLNYIANAANAPDVIGQLSGMFAPLARPLPLDYASAGMVGALLGYWSTTERPQMPVGTALFRRGVAVRSVDASTAVPPTDESIRGGNHSKNLTPDQ